MHGGRYKMKVLILSCSTGGGHNAAAYAMKEQFDKRNIQCDVKEFLDIFNSKIANVVNKVYIKTTESNGKYFKNVYKLGELYDKTPLISPVYTANSMTKKKLYEYITDNKYDYVIATHLFPAQALTSLNKKHKIHFTTIATDYECIPFWKEVAPDYFIIPHKDLEVDFLTKGVSHTKLIPMGIPVSENYSKDVKKEALINELGLSVGKKYILVMSGSMGFGKIEDIVKELDKNVSSEYCILTACGNNEEMKENIQSLYSLDRVVPFTFTKEIYKYVRISELVLSKPGGLSTTEICTANIPLIHTMPIPGCETKNAIFFQSHGMSVACNNIEEIVEATKNILENDNIRISMVKHQQQNIDRFAASNICDYIVKNNGV